MKRYDKYKEIPAPWLSKIPIHWSFRKIRYAFNERSEKGYPHEPLLSATQSHGVIPQALYESRMVSASKDFHLLKLVEVGDFVISLRSFQGGIEYAYYRGIISPAYTIMSPRDIIDSGYFRYLAKSEDFIRLLQTCVTGIREGQNIDYKTLRRNVMPIPPKGEQEQIVRYLNWKVSLINKFVKEKKREVALLKELKNAEINHAVTRGLNSESPLKDSGIEWIGQIPAYWRPFRIKQISRFNPSIQPILKDYTNDDQVVFLPMDKISSNGEIDNSEKRPIGVVRNGFTSFKRNDIVIAKITPCFENGKCALLSDLETIIGYGTTELIVIEPKNDVVINRYLLLILRSEIFRKNGANFMTGSAGQKRIPVKYIEDFSIGIPSVPEQQQIIDYIAEKEERINKAISDIEREIDLVKEYKARLISDVVTGKVDVRGIVVPDFQSESEVIEATEEEADDQTEIN